MRQKIKEEGNEMRKRAYIDGVTGEVVTRSLSDKMQFLKKQRLCSRVWKECNI